MITPKDLAPYVLGQVRVRIDIDGLSGEIIGYLFDTETGYQVEWNHTGNRGKDWIGFDIKSVSSVSDTGGKNPEALIVLK